MDPFEEFEMKPITEGLGFHKKTSHIHEQKLKKDFVNDLDSATPRVSTPLDQATASLDELLKESEQKNKKVSFTDPLPRLEDVEIDPRNLKIPTTGFPLDAPASLEVPSVKEELPEPKPALIPDPELSQQDLTQRGASDSLVNNLKPVAVSFASSFLDVMIVFAVSLIFMVSFLLVTEVKLETIFVGLQTDLVVQAVLGVFYLAIYQMYILVSRCFFGKTLGEWTFDYQMGDDQQIEKLSYPLKIIARSIIHILTGVIVLPLLSFIIRRDLSYYITGLRLYRRT